MVNKQQSFTRKKIREFGTDAAYHEIVRRFENSAPVSPLLRSLVARLASDTWADVTGGTGVVLVDGKPVDAPRKRGRPRNGV